MIDITTGRNSDDDDNSFDTGDAFKKFSRPCGCTHDIWLSKQISSELNDYIELLQFLEEGVSENDLINLKLANYGGDVHSGIALAHAINNCKANIITHVKSNCYSMAAILALCGDALLLYPGNYLMFHNYSGGNIGKGGELETSQAATTRAFRDYFKYFCMPFLTDKEINFIMDDRDLYIHHDDESLNRRLKRHFKRMEWTK